MTRTRKMRAPYFVMAGLDPAIQNAACDPARFLDGPVKPGHDKEAREV
jgi:hypothetical protein